MQGSNCHSGGKSAPLQNRGEGPYVSLSRGMRNHFRQNEEYMQKHGYVAGLSGTARPIAIQNKGG